uniref:Uncharacterized protein n=1 Tax=Panagrolaimus davidi TaxID=227884 RepID=A0A914QIA2_9BILA
MKRSNKTFIGNRKSFLKRSQIISRVHPSQNATLSDEREQVNFGEFEFRDFDDVHSEEPEAEAMDAQPQQLQQNFADPLLSSILVSSQPKNYCNHLDPYLQQTIITVHAVKESLSGAGLDRLLSMMGTLFQNSLVVNSKDIQREKENWVAPFRVKETVYCDGVGCKKSLPSLRTVCPCGANKNKKIILSTATIIPHVLILVKKYETELFMQR